RFLTYYSDLDAEQIEHAVSDEDMAVWKNGVMDTILGAYESVVLDHSCVTVWDEKMTLFFRSQRGQKVMLFCRDPEIQHNLSRNLDSYFAVESGDAGANISEKYGSSFASLVFLDSTIGEDKIMEILHEIRTTCSRRKTSVIILPDKLHKISVLRYRDAGTDNIIAKPYTQNRLLSKIFESVTADRRT
ncbi:MAG: response regulator, partial [Spirochaetaceae bacterium]